MGGGVGGRAFQVEGLKVKALRWDWIRSWGLPLSPLYNEETEAQKVEGT